MRQRTPTLDCRLFWFLATTTNTLILLSSSAHCFVRPALIHSPSIRCNNSPTPYNIPCTYHNKHDTSCSFYSVFQLRSHAAVPETLDKAPVSTDNINGIAISSTDEKTNTTDSEILSSKDEEDEEEDAFTMLAEMAATCILECERKRDAVGKGANSQASSATNWIDEKSSFFLKQAFDKLQFKLLEDGLDRNKARRQKTLLDRDQINMWLRWMKASPAPTILDLSQEFRRAANATLQNSQYMTMMKDYQNRKAILSRIGFRMYLLPSGSTLSSPIQTPPGSICFGTLLYGGVTRFRLLSNSNGRNKIPRRAAERTVTMALSDQQSPSWVQYGGPDRNYEAVDMGSAAVLELWIQPRGTEVEPIFDAPDGNNVVLSQPMWNPQSMFHFVNANAHEENAKDQTSQTSVNAKPLSENKYTKAFTSTSGKELNDAFEANFRSTLGGLQPQIQAVIRRVLDGRIIRPAAVDVDNGNGNGNGNDQNNQKALLQTSLDAEELASLGLSPVRGLLLYGPPGCGKTAMAREISRILGAKNDSSATDRDRSASTTLRIVSAPELLDRWVGGSERLVRDLFSAAEAELRACNGDASQSSLHVIIIDEIDAVFRKRSMADDSGEATRSSAVNQILAKLDGVNAIPNVLLIGMTNRRELLDDALLRPGRLEVQIEIPFPNKEGRREILQIMFESLRKRGRLSQPLCRAIDGVYVPVPNSVLGEEQDHDITINSNIKERERKRHKVKRAVKKIFSTSILRTEYDLADDSVTGGYSGADLAGLVRCAGSLALSRARRAGGGIENLLITLEDVKEALLESKV